MSLDSKQKRGSVMNLTMPGRPWLAEPDGTLTGVDRLSIMTYAGAISPEAPGDGGDSAPYQTVWRRRRGR